MRRGDRIPAGAAKSDATDAPLKIPDMTTTDSSPEGVQAHLAQLFVYPVKSCAGVELREALLTESGLDLDRTWMVVDDRGRFLSQREQPRMALIQPKIRAHDVVLRAPGMLALHLGINEVETATRVQVWDDEVPAWDMGPTAAQWFSDFLGQPGLRLVRFDPDVRRLSSARWTGGLEAPVEFADGFALLVTSTASLAGLNARLQAAGHAPVGMERFRPNLVIGGVQEHDEDRLDVLHIASTGGPVRMRPVKPCARCPIPDVDPASAALGTAVRDALQGYRQDPRLGGAITFGMNAIVLEGAGQTLRVGDAVRARYRFD